MTTKVHDQDGAPGGAVGLTLAGAFLLGAILLVSIVLIPPDELERVALRFSGDSAIDAFAERLADVSQRALWSSLFLVLVGFALLVLRRTAGLWLITAIQGIRGFSKTLASSAFRCLVDHPLLGVTLAGLTLSGLVLRSQGLHLPTTTDEAQTIVRYASRSFLWIVTMHPTANNHVPHSLLVHGVGSLFGYSPFVIRLPTLVAGLAIIPLTFGLARLCVGRQAAIIASAFAAVSYRLVEYSAQARGYSMTIALLLLGGLCVAYLIRSDDSKDSQNETATLLLGVFCSLALWTMVSALYGVVALFLWWSCTIAVRKRWQDMKHVFVAGSLMTILTVLLYLPILLIGGLEALLPKSIYSDYSRLESVAYLATQFPIALSGYFFPGLSWLLIAAGSVLLGLGMWTQFRTRAEVPLSPALFAIITIAVMLPIQSYGPSLGSLLRTFIWMQPFLYIAVGAGIWGLLQLIPRASAQKWIGSVLAIGIAVAVTLATPYAELEEARMDYSGLSDPAAAYALVQDHLQPGDGLSSPNRIYWNLQYQFLLHETSRRPFQQATGSRFSKANRILLVGHNTMQDEAELAEEIRTRRGVVLERPLQVLGTAGNMTLYVTGPF